MRASEKGLVAGRNPAAILTFWNSMHRYRCLVLRYWWVLALTLSLAVCAAAAYEMTRPMSYMSTATLSVDVENRRPTFSGDQAGSGFTQQLEDFVPSQIEIIKGPMVTQMASEQLQAKHPDEPASPVALEFVPKNNLIIISATGANPAHTQHYLQARVEGYLKYRKRDRDSSTVDSLDKIREQSQHLEEALKTDDDAIIDYQRKVGVVFQTGTGAGSGNALTELRQKLQVLTDESDQLRLMTPEQGFEHPEALRPHEAAPAGGGGDSAESRSALESSSAEADYRQAQGDLVKVKAQLDDFSRDLRPKHPKIIALNAQLESDKKVVASLLDQNRLRIQNRLQLVQELIKSTQDQIKVTEPKVLDTDLLRAKFNTLEEQKQRDQKTYDDLQATYSKTSLTNQVDPDKVHMIGEPSAPEPVPSGWIKAMAMAVVAGLAAGIGVLFCIDRMDDTMGSIADFQQHFAENIIGQIPRDATSGAGDTELLRPDDDRHMLVESFRNLRSTLLYMPLDGNRPKTLLVTSAVPNEGKSTVSSNLALVLASAGMKTLLVDADLRRGAIHTAFGLSRDPGLTDVLGHDVPWENAVRTTSLEHLHVLPRGRNVAQPSEYLLSRATDRLIKELYPKYDYIIIDSSPILAADDTASLAPKIDATLFVVRLSFTSAKMTRKSLEILYNRQANIPGLILNQVDTSSPEFVYYQYAEYYNNAPDNEPADSIAKSKSIAKVG